MATMDGRSCRSPGVHTWCEKFVHELHCNRNDKSVVCDSPFNGLDESLARWRIKCVPSSCRIDDNPFAGAKLVASKNTDDDENALWYRLCTASAATNKKFSVFDPVVVELRADAYKIHWPRWQLLYKHCLSDLVEEHDGAGGGNNWSLEDCAFVERPDKQNVTARTMLARKFFAIRRADNLPLYVSGDLLTKVRARAIEPCELDAAFASRRLVNAYMLSSVDGIVKSRNVVELQSIDKNNKTYKYITFLPMIKPIAFFIIEE
uniref:DNA binding protein-2 n=1 Tax=Lymantria dispar multicapsid nuclear polyhedrosis virus TaxID=10449 RepID=A0A1B1MR03_NPVLD|nr:DNA binding protein-2 [Lymantria dispar multiple nucleopolyhedrovirus]